MNNKCIFNYHNYSVVLIGLFLFVIQGVSAQEFNYLPTSTTSQIIEHSHYTLSYSEVDEQAEWVAYKLTPEMINGSIHRTDNFRADPDVKTKSAVLSDYRGSGYDRGHLAPAADFKFNQEAMSESFYLSNMSPQNPSFNRGIWKKLEERCRRWAVTEGEVYVVTGGILSYAIDTIGQNKVTVPDSYYKIILDIEPEYRVVGFVLPNEKGTKSLSEYVISIDSIEVLTGIDFFPAIPDSIENRLESVIDIDGWSFGDSNIKQEPKTQKQQTQVKHDKCQGTTKSGKECKRKATSGSKFCWQHQPDK
jgi:endonuclease G, mitochondrial